MSDLNTYLQTGLPKVTFIFGDEPLLVEESCDAVRLRAQELGYERLVITIESAGDWEKLTDTTHTMSLFSTHRLIDLRLPTGKPGDAGSKVLVQYCQSPPEDTSLLIVSARLDGRARQAKWYKQIENVGVVIEHKPVTTEQLPGWIRSRARSKGIDLEPNTETVLAHYLEGNLLAAAQEIDKLALLTDVAGTIRAVDIEQGITDNARFNIFTLTDHCLAGKADKALRSLYGLKREGVEPILVVWALAKQIRTLYCLATAIEGGEPKAPLFKKHRIWTKQATLINTALNRIGAQGWAELLQRMAHLDRVLKGRAVGDIWQALEQTCLSLSGQRTLAV